MDLFTRVAALLLLAGSVFLNACSEVGRHPDEPLARTACSSCHLFPQPELLHGAAWAQQVLPDMGRRMGIHYLNGQPYQDIYSETGLPADRSTPIPFEDWRRILEYYRSEAPQEQPQQDRAPVEKITPLFAVSRIKAGSTWPATTYVRIDPGNQCLYWGSAADSTFSLYTPGNGKSRTWKLGSVPIDLSFEQDLKQAGPRSGIFTNIGILNPNNGRTGSVQPFRLPDPNHFTAGPRFLDSLPRPVQVTATDLDGDGDADYLVCGFGHDNGAFFWMRNNGGKLEQVMLRSLPGCIRAIIDDFNQDGLPDILALFAQAREGVYLFTNKGNGTFDTKALLEFPPVYGSSYFDYTDLDGDGRKDILYTCGDNADLTAQVLKNYHGIYLFLNKGGGVFKQEFFYPIHGCYKALARDFDRDGDLDLAAISYFPDKKGQPGEAFVYLEQKGNFRYTAYTIAEHKEGNWLTMDAGDADGDGDDDIVIGSMQPPNRSGSSSSPALLLLRNRTK